MLFYCWKKLFVIDGFQIHNWWEDDCSHWIQKIKEVVYKSQIPDTIKKKISHHIKNDFCEQKKKKIPKFYSEISKFFCDLKIFFPNLGTIFQSLGLFSNRKKKKKKSRFTKHVFSLKGYRHLQPPKFYNNFNYFDLRLFQFICLQISVAVTQCIKSNSWLTGVEYSIWKDRLIVLNIFIW